VQAADAEFVDLDDAEARASYRETVNEQPAEGERADCDRSDRESSYCEAADALGFGRLGTDRLSANRCRWRSSRG
jgi:hypothetical protein